MEDAVRPNDEAFMAMVDRGFRVWSGLPDLAQRQGNQTIQLACLRRIDSAFAHYPRLSPEVLIRTPVQGFAIATGSSSWEVSDSLVDLPPLHEGLQLQMGTPKSVPLTVLESESDHHVLPYLVLPEDENHVTILILAWTYILAARWSELLPGISSLQYSSGQTPWYDPLSGNDVGCAIVDVGEASDVACRWWAAVLAPGDGWTAQMCLENHSAMHSPWSTSLDLQCRFAIKRDGHLPNTAAWYSAPTYREALSYLEAYVFYHGLSDQSRAALATALFIPVAAYESRVIRLPAPRLGRNMSKRTHVGNQPPFGVSDALVDRLLPLSCNAHGMKALLHSVLYEPDVPCNLCGAWVLGAQRALGRCEPGALLSTLMMRDPGIGFLWVGVFLSGSYERFIWETAHGHWKVDLVVAAMTGTSMSFVQEPTSSLEPGIEQLSRADECRLRYLSYPNVEAPAFVFPPFGSAAMLDVDVEIRRHAYSGVIHSHRLKSFSWNTSAVRRDPDVTGQPPLRSKNGDVVLSESSGPSRPTDLERATTEECSKNTTQRAFVWLREARPVSRVKANDADQHITMDGRISWPVPERGIFEHEWVAAPNWDDLAQRASP